VLGANYFVKLENVTTGFDEMTFYVRGGSTITRNAPLGEFILNTRRGDRGAAKQNSSVLKLPSIKPTRRLSFGETITPTGFQRRIGRVHEHTSRSRLSRAIKSAA
jgi:hypothetical protein